VLHVNKSYTTSASINARQNTLREALSGCIDMPRGQGPRGLRSSRLRASGDVCLEAQDEGDKCLGNTQGYQHSRI
jgi:hypothetical protein